MLLIKEDLDAWRPGEHTGTFRRNNLALVARRSWSAFRAVGARARRAVKWRGLQIDVDVHHRRSRPECLATVWLQAERRPHSTDLGMEKPISAAIEWIGQCVASVATHISSRRVSTCRAAPDGSRDPALYREVVHRPSEVGCESGD